MQRILTVVALWLACGGGVPCGYAQQILCEWVWRGTQAHVGLYASDLLRLQPDSLRLVAGYQAAASTGFYSFPTTTALRRIEVGTCDTLPVPGSGFVTQTSLCNGTMALATRRGQVLVASGYSDNANRPIELRLLGRDGQMRWTRTLSGLTSNKNLSGLLEAPDRGFFWA
jgi:hypothetical protein